MTERSPLREATLDPSYFFLRQPPRDSDEIGMVAIIKYNTKHTNTYVASTRTSKRSVDNPLIRSPGFSVVCDVTVINIASRKVVARKSFENAPPDSITTAGGPPRSVHAEIPTAEVAAWLNGLSP